MAVTIAQIKRVSWGNAHVRYVDITGPASYTNPGGETLSAANIATLAGPGRVIGDIAEDLLGVSPTGHILILDRANSKIKYYNGTTEISNATNLGAVVARCRIVYGIFG